MRSAGPVDKRGSARSPIWRVRPVSDAYRPRIVMPEQRAIFQPLAVEQRSDRPHRHLIALGLGLADALIGLDAGAQRSFQLTLPEDFSSEELRSATVDVDGSVSAVRERILPPLDDTLAALGEHVTLAEFRAD